MTEAGVTDAPFWIHVLRTLLDRCEVDRKVTAAMGAAPDPERMRHPQELLATYEDDEILSALQAMLRADDARISRVLQNELARRSVSAGV